MFFSCSFPRSGLLGVAFIIALFSDDTSHIMDADVRKFQQSMACE